ncbi:MAG: MotA/TolQ/ExbB proton channel family protein [Bacteroidales bacterium]|nr:MotA/TolQ/ExbB proton channel family protein [Bacteroidales bacterium]
MKKLIAFLFLVGMITLTVNKFTYAQDTVQNGQNQEVAATDSTTDQAEEPDPAALQDLTPPSTEGQSFHYMIKEKFIEGGAGFMFVILLCLVIGLALCIERILYLNLSSTNTDKLIKQVEDALANGGINAAKEVCKNTRGPVASIYYQGLDRFDEGLDVVEKSIVSYGSVLMGRLETNLTWISLFIAVAPMLGFMGTVIGMIGAFDAIAAAGDISPAIVASGIKVALLTTVFGLIVAVILQVFYNYIVSKIDSMVNKMENASINLMDVLIKNKK